MTFRSGSCKDLEAKLQFLLQDDTLVERYRSMAKYVVFEKYDWERVTDQYVALYKSLLAKKDITHEHLIWG